jgi:hypothetical protein
MERDLADLRGFTSGEEFLAWVERVLNAELTSDFWTVTLPNRLDTSSPNSPVLFAYLASLNLLDARALFSKKKTRDVLDPTIKSTKSAVERHHLFPKGYLAALGVDSVRQTNQIANFALVEWNDNIAISDSPPSEYVPKYLSHLTNKEWADQQYWHALPRNWHEMEYADFLEARRKGIAAVIRDGFDRLTHGDTVAQDDDTFEARISRGEGPQIEFKETLRVNLHTKQPDTKMEHAVLKTIAAFLNSRGGTLFVGVDDTGQVKGLDADGFQSEDKLLLHLDNLIKERLGPAVFSRVRPTVATVGGKRCLAVECDAANKPVFLKGSQGEEFFIRTGASSPALPHSHAHDYIQQHFK